jgi:XTP/dITP diphosphohydrolase
MTKLLVVATGNPGKLREMQAYLADLAWELTLKPEELEVEETGDTFAANACLKASEGLRGGFGDRKLGDRR